jgi:hypothetical protein
MALLERFDEELTYVNIGDKKFELREMKIGRTRKLFELIFNIQSDLSRFFRDAEGNPLKETDQLDPGFNAAVDEGTVRIFNFIFSLSAAEKLDSDWIMNNLSMRQIEEIVKTAANQSRVDWLIPFFAPFIRVGSALRIPEKSPGNR